MTDFDYPPTRGYQIGAALEQAEQRVEDADDEGTRQRAENQRDALAWAVRQWGKDATIELQAYTARTRARVLDTLRNDVMGEPGAEETSIWLTAAGLTDAPWLDDLDIQSKAEATQQLPPALVDWLDRQLDDINDLTEGN